jgi:hypothetical protein
MNMQTYTQINLFGSLRKKMEDIYELPIQFDLNSPIQIVDVLRRFDIPLNMVQLAMVNFRAVPKNSKIKPGDRLSLFPREYPIFADWKDLKF